MVKKATINNLLIQLFVTHHSEVVLWTALVLVSGQQYDICRNQKVCHDVILIQFETGFPFNTNGPVYINTQQANII